MLALTEAALDAAKSFGAEAADAVASRSISLAVEVRLGKLETVERSESASLGLRVLVGRQQAAAATSDLRPQSVRDLAERVTAMAKAAPEDPYCGLAPNELLGKSTADLDLFDPSEPSAEDLEQRAIATENAAMAVAGVTNSSGAEASWGEGDGAFAASNGFRGAWRASSHSLGVSVIAAADGAMERDYEGRGARWREDLPSPESIGKKAGERAAAKLGSRKLDSQKINVIFDRRVSGGLIGSMLGAISGSAVARGVSFLKDKLGQQVFASGIDIVDDPFRRRGFGARQFDGEGVMGQTRKLIDDGVLTTWLLNCAAARQLGLQTTGHASRGVGSPPGIDSNNVHLKPGDQSPEQMMQTVKKGLYITESFGPSLNSNTGDYSAGVAGFWFEDGAIAFPVSEITVAGNMLDIYRRLVPGSDLEFRGGVNAPSILVEDLTLAGR
ncbi:MAG: TldD/PmbA family protein [Caulobacterales bacterium]